MVSGLAETVWPMNRARLIKVSADRFIQGSRERVDRRRVNTTRRVNVKSSVRPPKILEKETAALCTPHLLHGAFNFVERER